MSAISSLTEQPYKSVIVLNIPRGLSSGEIERHFLLKRNGGCGDVVRVVFLDADFAPMTEREEPMDEGNGFAASAERRIARVEFESAQTVTNVLAKEQLLPSTEPPTRLVLVAGDDIFSESTTKMSKPVIDRLSTLASDWQSLVPKGVKLTSFDERTQRWTVTGSLEQLNTFRTNVLAMLSGSNGSASALNAGNTLPTNSTRSTAVQAGSPSRNGAPLFSSVRRDADTVRTSPATVQRSSSDYGGARPKVKLFPHIASRSPLPTPRGASNTEGRSTTGLQSARPAAGANTSANGAEECTICMESLLNGVPYETLTLCTHRFHTQCIRESFQKVRPCCPICRTVYGVPTGLQPRNGRMEITKKAGSLPGYETCANYFDILYTFNAGVQEAGHPHPGTAYFGDSRRAYLPATPLAARLLALLKIAFDNRLIFTVGMSTTRGVDDVITWNGIHHKTQRHGGAQNFGYPDAGYLERLEKELADIGVVRSMVDERVVEELLRLPTTP